jgi:hypothetical protein
MKDKDTLMSEGFFIGFMSILGYSIAFAYEYGYASYYGIPWQLISLSLQQVIVSVGIMLAFLPPLYASTFYASFMSALDRKPHPTKRLVQALLLVGCIWAITAFSGWYQQELMPILVWASFSLIVEVGYDLAPKIEQIAEYFAARKGTPLEQASEIFSDPIEKVIGITSPRLLVIATGIILLAFYVGLGVAMSQKEYNTDSSVPGVVILGIYGDTVVSHQYNSKELKLTGDFIVSKITSERELRFKTRTIGHLKRTGD